MKKIVHNKTGQDITEYERLIRAAVRETLFCEKTGRGAEITVAVVNDDEMKELNFRYRQKDSVTDCLAYAYSTRPVLGDIVICLPQAMRQAQQLGHSVKREVGFLAAHSTLHLLGYEHETPEDLAVMVKKQELVLEALGLSREVYQGKG